MYAKSKCELKQIDNVCWFFEVPLGSCAHARVHAHTQARQRAHTHTQAHARTRTHAKAHMGTVTRLHTQKCTSTHGQAVDGAAETKKNTVFLKISLRGLWQKSREHSNMTGPISELRCIFAITQNGRVLA